ncbi:MAG: creatininase family protein [Nitrospirae bacterium]|nr:creatininase family protein [Nitrospirota bacterium]
MILEEITMEDFKEHLKICRTIIFPFGTIEEHGSHLPLYTDTLIAWEVLKQAVQKRPVFLAPAVPYGVCTTTGRHPGTIGITPTSLRAITLDLIKDAYGKGLRNFLLVSGHGGGIHMHALKEVAETLIDELDDIRMAVLSPYDVLWKEFSALCETSNDSHAGELETSLVMALRPGLVKGISPEEYPQFPRPFIVRDKMKYWPNGVWGNPAKATTEKGQKAFTLAVERMVELIDEVEKMEKLHLWQQALERQK